MERDRGERKRGRAREREDGWSERGEEKEK
jgi:hypothetical protein